MWIGVNRLSIKGIWSEILLRLIKVDGCVQLNDLLDLLKRLNRFSMRCHEFKAAPILRLSKLASKCARRRWKLRLFVMLPVPFVGVAMLVRFVAGFCHWEDDDLWQNMEISE